MNEINSIYQDIQILKDYTKSIKEEGKNFKGKKYIRIVGGHLVLTQHKIQQVEACIRIVNGQLEFVESKIIQQATEQQIREYFMRLRYNICIDEITPEKILLQKLSKAFSQYIDVVKHKFYDLSDEKSTLTEINLAKINLLENSPFYAMDLIVLKDSYQGTIPLNGIKETEFNEISNWISSLKQASSIGNLSIVCNAYINNTLMHKDLVIDMIAMLCTRRIGRELLRNIIEANQQTSIHPTKFSHSYASLFEGIDPAIYLEMEAISFNKTFANKNEATPRFIVLGHELCHVLHHIQSSSSFKNRIQSKVPSLTDLEEQLTILGWGKKNYEPSSLLNPKKLSEDEINEIIETMNFEDWDQEHNVLKEIEKNYSDWEKISENGLRSVFGISPRAEHYGTTVSQTKWLINQKETILDELRHGRNYSEAIDPLFIDLIDQTNEWNNFLTKILSLSCELRLWDIVSDLLKRATNPYFKEILNENLIVAYVNQNRADIQTLITLGADKNLLQSESRYFGYQLVNLYHFNIFGYPEETQKTLIKNLLNHKSTIEIFKNWETFLSQFIHNINYSENYKLMDDIFVILDEADLSSCLSEQHDILKVLLEKGFLPLLSMKIDNTITDLFNPGGAARVEELTPFNFDLLSLKWGKENLFDKLLELACNYKKWDLLIPLKQKGADLDRISDNNIQFGLKKALDENHAELINLFQRLETRSLAKKLKTSFCTLL